MFANCPFLFQVASQFIWKCYLTTLVIWRIGSFNAILCLLMKKLTMKFSSCLSFILFIHVYTSYGFEQYVLIISLFNLFLHANRINLVRGTSKSYTSWGHHIVSREMMYAILDRMLESQSEWQKCCTFSTQSVFCVLLCFYVGKPAI